MVVTRSKSAAKLVSAFHKSSPRKDLRVRKNSRNSGNVSRKHSINSLEKKTSIKVTTTGTSETVNKVPIFSLSDDCVLGTFRCRPSKRNRSPYVGDVYLDSEQREAIVHLPSLDMGGKCQPGSQLLMKPARDRKGNLVGKDAVSAKYGTPKCEFIAQLLWVDESSLGPPGCYETTWVGAHPSLGEALAEVLVRDNLLGPSFPPVESFRREVTGVAGTDMRADFLITHRDDSGTNATLSPPKPRVLEVKTVVDTDYFADAPPPVDTPLKCVYTSEERPYCRTAIFPWGAPKQKGPDGETVVSTRAIKHLRELTRLTKGGKYSATVLFIVIRHDAKRFRPNYEACPSFTRYLKEARDAGVQILAKQVVWGEGNDVGKAFEGKLLDVVWP